jgi:hypothetical protein
MNEALGSPAPSGPALDGLGPGGPAHSGSIHMGNATLVVANVLTCNKHSPITTQP